MKKDFLDVVTEKIGEKLEDCEFPSDLSKKSMTVCCETFVLTNDTAKKLLDAIDQLLEEHFFRVDGLLQLGWCSNYMLGKRVLNYPKDSGIPKTQVVEFYWFNQSSIRFNKRLIENSIKVIRNCLHCYIYK